MDAVFKRLRNDVKLDIEWLTSEFNEPDIKEEIEPKKRVLETSTTKEDNEYEGDDKNLDFKTTLSSSMCMICSDIRRELQPCHVIEVMKHTTEYNSIRNVLAVNGLDLTRLYFIENKALESIYKEMKKFVLHRKRSLRDGLRDSEFSNKLRRRNNNVMCNCKVCNKSILTMTEEELLNEQLLFHCTTVNPMHLIENGLDERYSPGGNFGKGIYLAEDPLKANCYYKWKQTPLDASNNKAFHQTQFFCQDKLNSEYVCFDELILDPDEKKGERFMFGCMALLGDILHLPKGRRMKDLIVEPQKPCGLRYDSVSGNINGQSEFVVYRRDLIWTKYLIYYTPKPLETAPTFTTLINRYPERLLFFKDSRFSIAGSALKINTSQVCDVYRHEFETQYGIQNLYDTYDVRISSITSLPECPICLNSLYEAKISSSPINETIQLALPTACNILTPDISIAHNDHYIHVECAKSLQQRCTNTDMNGDTSRYFKCPYCMYSDGIRIGDQPLDGNMYVKFHDEPLEGHNGEFDMSIAILYKFHGGKQNVYHPNPGREYPAVSRVAFLPFTKDGLMLLEGLIVAWIRRLTFTIDVSRTTGDEGITWGIHHKTNMKGGPPLHGYPDPTYTLRLRQELLHLGIDVNTEKPLLKWI